MPLELAAKSAEFTKFTEVTDVGLTQVQSHTYILDLMRNPGARTTKTVASLLMIARAAAHIRRTGERVLLLTPTSGNKGTALRDAVARAYETGLATPDELRIAVLAPRRRGPAAGLSAHRRAVPADGEPDGPRRRQAAGRCEAAQQRGRGTVRRGDLRHYGLPHLVHARPRQLPHRGCGARLRRGRTPATHWAVRARVHAHAVSSAFGLLGYHLGHQLLTDGLPGFAAPATHPASSSSSSSPRPTW
ncbi:DUF6002 family protein [Streptomyces sp. M10(2022)]